MGIRASATRELVFQNCFVPEENVIGKPGMGFILTMKLLDRARPGVGAQALGIAQGALEAAVDYTAQRVQFGQPLISLPVVASMLADMAIQVEAARALVYAAARMVDSGAKDITEGSAASQSICFGYGHASLHRRCATLRRRGLHAGLSRRKNDAGCQNNPDI